jgi:hypothetical protein
MIKLFIKLVVAVVFLLVIGLVVLYFSLNRIVKSTIETEGTKELHVTTTLGAADLGIREGSIGLTNFALGSPSGFTAPQMMTVGDIKVDAGGVTHLIHQPIHLSSIIVTQPKMVVEEVNGKLNFKVLMDQMPSDPNKQPATSPDGSKHTKVIIDTLTVTGPHVDLDLEVSVVKLKKKYSVDLPDFTIKNIGNADGLNNGAAIKDVVTTVIARMIDDASKKEGLPLDSKALLAGGLAGVQDKLIDAGKSKLPASVSGLVDQFTKPGPDGKPANPVQNEENAAKNLLKGLGH